MVIYEVNLAINSDIYSEYTSWLQDHAKEMLQFPGFIQAILLKPEQEGLSEQKQLTVQYQLENRESLERYLVEFAPKMRAGGINLFKDQFSATRRIFEVQKIILK